MRTRRNTVNSEEETPIIPKPFTVEEIGNMTCLSKASKAIMLKLAHKQALRIEVRGG